MEPDLQQIRRSPTPDEVPSYASEAVPSNESRLLLDYLLLLGRNKLILCFLAGFGLAAALLFSYFRTPLYLARASIEIQGLNGDYLNLKSFDPTTVFQDYSPEGQILTQAKILESDSVVERVVAVVNSHYVNNANESKESIQKALAYASDTLQVRLVPDTHILQLLSSSPNNRIAADFVNAMAKEYVDQNLQSRIRATEQTEIALGHQLAEARTKLRTAEQDLLSYAQQNHLMFTGEAHTSVAEDKLRQVQEALSTAESERAVKQSQFEATSTVAPELLPSILDDATAHDEENKLAELRSDLANSSTYMAPTHPKIVRLKAQIAAMETSIRNQGLRLAKKVSNDFEAVRRRESLLQANYDAQSKLVAEQAQEAIQYTILKRETETNRALYESLLQKVKEAGVAKSMQANNVRVLDQAKVPAKPFSPSFLRNALMGFIGGLLIGIAFVTVRERADFNIRSPGETASRLRVPELGVIPAAEPGAIGSRLLLDSNVPAHQSLVKLNRNDGMLTIAGNGRSTVLAESFRATLASLLFSNRNGQHGAIVITSAAPSEGKSTILSNLGLAMAETDRRVLLIDGDLRRPQLHKILGVSNEFGLTDWLRSGDFSEQAIAKRAVRVDPVSNLYVLPAGSASANISNLLHSVRLPKLLRALREEFDAVLIDSPPMIQFPDARVLGRAAGGVVLVIRSGQTSRDTATAAMQRLTDDGTMVIGTILNGWDMQGPHGAAYRKYYDSIRRHSSENGVATGREQP